MTNGAQALGRAMVKVLLLAAACLALASCGGTPLGGGGLLGSSSSHEGWSATVTEANLLTAAQSGGNPGGSVGEGCPAFEVASGGGFIIMNGAGGMAPNDPLAVLHRGEITKTARECHPGPGGVLVKYGFSGRVLLGPQGKAGLVTLPVKISVVDGVKRTLKTEQIKLAVQIQSGQPVGYFSMVREIVVPVAEGAAPVSYKVFVGFDRSVPGAS